MNKYVLQTEDDFEKYEDTDKNETDDCQQDVLIEPYEALVYSMMLFSKLDDAFVLTLNATVSV